MYLGKAAKWGNSLALRLPAALVKELGLTEGDPIQIDVRPEQPLLLTRDRRREEALARIAAANWKLPKGWKFDRDEANSR